MVDPGDVANVLDVGDHVGEVAGGGGSARSSSTRNGSNRASSFGSIPAARAASSAASAQSRLAWFTNRGTNDTMHSPPPRAMVRSSTSSGTLRGWSVSA